MDDKFQNLKVMVIDDSKTIRRTAETLLQREGCDVVTAVDGFEALSKIAEANPDIVFVDIMLSSKDGLFDQAKGRVVGSDEYLTKPFSKDELLNAIRNHVSA
ncbi:MAG: Transcriptional regulatory protein WalR [Acinetobacter bereziniae]|uniref:Transcriptional regulatory protein WalR n=1 Tax=Acinetobacter bereziniae TaxID=106648 RepID=A0A833PD68_ACIBZ|nr:MAG: Transcriptional regulatory protein WalR [Acinetobacter bereziniae]